MIYINIQFSSGKFLQDIFMTFLSIRIFLKDVTGACEESVKKFYKEKRSERMKKNGVTNALD